MPSPEEILSGLKMIANNWRLLAVLWHVYFILLVLVLVLGMRPTKRIAGLLLVLPIFSVSILAWIYANPFNGAFFALTSIVLTYIALRLPAEPVRVAPPWLSIVGTLMIGFGWVYPHFLDDSPFITYLYAAPTGLIPCPTLSIVIGFTLLLNGLRSRSWCLVLTIVGLFYGIFGAGRLGVRIDWVLLVGTFLTAYTAFSHRLIKGTHAENAR